MAARPPSLLIRHRRWSSIGKWILTVALESLVNKSVEQRSAVVAERRTAVRVQFELVSVRRLHRTQKITQKRRLEFRRRPMALHGPTASNSCYRQRIHRVDVRAKHGALLDEIKMTTMMMLMITDCTVVQAVVQGVSKTSRNFAVLVLKDRSRLFSRPISNLLAYIC